jgi:diguanylate cyclase (GGDEF)-like protein
VASGAPNRFRARVAGSLNGAALLRMLAANPAVTVAYFVVVAVLREAGGGSGGGVGLLALLPVIAAALHGTRRRLNAVIAGVAAMYLIPIVVIGTPQHPLAISLRLTAFMVVFSTVIGLTIHRLVGELREREQEREALLERLDHLAHTDALTGLPNRRAWYEALHRSLRSAIRTGGALSVAILDLDEFKRINDDHGHQAGDRLLRELAAGWERELRGSDVVARLGGDEFAVLLSDCAGEHAEAIVDRLRQTAPPGHSVSAGVATWDGLETADEVVARADAALYAAKAAGRARLVVAPS